MSLQFKKKENDIDTTENQTEKESDPDNEDTVDVVLDKERENHRRRVVDGANEAGEIFDKALLHAERWGVYMREKLSLVKGGYSMEVSCSDGKKVVWEVIENPIFKEPKENSEIGLRGFDFNLFDEYEGGARKG